MFGIRVQPLKALDSHSGGAGWWLMTRQKDDTRTLGLRCAWCGKVLREPVGYPNPDDPSAWTHGICPDCQKRFEEDAIEHERNARASLVVR